MTNRYISRRNIIALSLCTILICDMLAFRHINKQIMEQHQDDIPMYISVLPTPIIPLTPTPKPVQPLISRGNIYNRTTLDILEDKGKQYGIPKNVWYPIAMYESGCNPKCHALSKYEDSRGIFQVNTKTNYPKGADKNKLFDVSYNADYQMPELKKWYDKGLKKGLYGVSLTQYVAKNGQRPKWNNKIANTIRIYYNECQ